MENWYKNKDLTRDEAIKVQYEMLLLSIVIKENAALLVQANIAQQDFPPFKDRLDAISNYTKSFSNPYFETNKLAREVQTYALTKAVNGELEEDKQNMTNEFYTEISKVYGRNV